MRRQSDNWVNATHILKAAGFDKPARTRILERDVQKGNHEKVQGGYGKFQGTKNLSAPSIAAILRVSGDSLTMEFYRFRNLPASGRCERAGPTA